MCFEILLRCKRLYRFFWGFKVQFLGNGLVVAAKSATLSNSSSPPTPPYSNISTYAWSYIRYENISKSVANLKELEFEGSSLFWAWAGL